MPRTAPSIVLEPAEQEAFRRLSSNPTSELRISQRAQIILCAAAGYSNTQIHEQLGLDFKTIGKWRSRYLQRRQEEPDSDIERWLNPIEIWFGVLARKVLRRGSFRSTSDLEEKVHRFVEYFNRKMARPYKFSTWEIAA